MLRKKTSSDLEDQGFKLRANKTIAKGSSSWQDSSGRMHFKEIVPTGSPDFVKKSLGASNNGEKTELEFAHNTKVWEREIESPDTKGVIKEREVIVEQSTNVGDGDDIAPDNSGNGDVYSDTTSVPESTGPSALQVLKNFVDKLYDYQRWTIAGLIITAVAVGVIYGIVYNSGA